MSSIAGVVSLTDSPAHVARCFDAVFQALVDAAGTPTRWQEQQCALGARVPLTATDGLRVAHFVHAATGCAIVFDGRLDNREELAAHLPDLRADAGDAEYVLHAYLHWAEECAAKLLGDFAFAIWDPRTRSLYAARDPLGVRPFFFAKQDSRLGFASDFKALLSMPGVTRTPDEFMVSEYLLWWTSFPDVSHTFFRDVRRLLPASWLRWNSLGLEMHRYWSIDPRRRIRYPRHQDYVEHFESLLTECVRARLRGCRKVGVFLSGGMDSSAVAILAARLADSPANVNAYCTQIPDANDESHLAELVAQKAGIAFRPYAVPLADTLDRLEAYVCEQAAPFVDLGAFNDAALLRMAAADGCGAVLTGDGSDELFNSAWAYVADLVRHLRIGKLVRELGPYARYNGRGPLELLTLSSRYFVPPPVLRAWKSVKWQQPPRWFNPEFAHRTELIQRLRWVRPRLPFDSFSADVDHDALTRGRRVLADEHREVQATSIGLHFRYPFYDRCLLEFMYAVRWEEKITGGRVKSFLREAPGLLPPEIAHLRAKANYNPYSEAQQDAQNWESLQTLFDSPPPQAAEFVDFRVARNVCHAFVRRKDSRHLKTFLTLASFFLWLKNFSSGEAPRHESLAAQICV